MRHPKYDETVCTSMVVPVLPINSHTNFAQVQIVGLEEESSEFICRNTFDHPYPTTKIMWIPDTKGVYPDLLATSGDYLRIWRVRAPRNTEHMHISLYRFCGIAAKNKQCQAPLV